MIYCIIILHPIDHCMYQNNKGIYTVYIHNIHICHTDVYPWVDTLQWVEPLEMSMALVSELPRVVWPTLVG